MPTTNSTGPESIVTSPEWSRRLRDAGWPQEQRVYSWLIESNGKWTLSTLDFTGKDKKWLENRGKTVAKNLGGQIGMYMIADNLKKQGHTLDDLSIAYAAPTAEEVLRRLPVQVPNHDLLISQIDGKPGMFRVNYERHSFTEYTYLAPDIHDTLANAAAAMWIHLKQNNLLPSDK